MSEPALAAVPVPARIDQVRLRLSHVLFVSLWGLAALCVLVLLALPFIEGPRGSGDELVLVLGRRNPEREAAVGQPKTSRGRTSGELPVQLVPPPLDPIKRAPAPEPSPTASPAVVVRQAPPAAGPGAGTAAGGGRSGSGIGSGSGPGLGVGRVVSSPRPAPLPAAVPAGYTRVRGRVVDALTLKPLPDVCLVIGVESCGPLQPYTDEKGIWIVDLPIVNNPIQWRIVFTKEGYEPTDIRFRLARGSVLVGDIRLRPTRTVR